MSTRSNLRAAEFCREEMASVASALADARAARNTHRESALMAEYDRLNQEAEAATERAIAAGEW